MIQFQTDFWQNMIQQRKPEPVFSQGSVSTFFMSEFYKTCADFCLKLIRESMDILFLASCLDS